MARVRTFEWQDPMATLAAADGRTGLEFLQGIIAGTIPAAPIQATLGFQLVAADHGFARFRGVPAEYHYNPMGAVHGGLACTLLDSAMGSAVMSLLDASEAYTTLDLTVHLTRAISAKTGPITAEGKIVQRGRRVATSEGRLTDEQGRLLAHASTTCLILPRETRETRESR